MFSVMMARSSSYAIVLHVVRNVLKWYHRLSLLAIGGVDLKYNEYIDLGCLIGWFFFCFD